MDGGTLCAQLMVHATREPNAVAIAANDHRLSYAELARSVLVLGGFLRSCGVGRGDRVALLLENSAEYVVALYGCWSVGAIAVPLNPGASVREVRRALEHAAASILVAEAANRALGAMVEGSAVRVVAVERKGASVDPSYRSWTALQTASPVDVVDCRLDDGALILYTSGTTGAPKGVLLTQKNLLANALSIIEYLELTAADSILALLPFHYSYGNSVLHTHLYAGAKLVLGPSMIYPQTVVAALRAGEITGLAGVAAMFALLLEKSDWLADIPRLRYVTQAGGPMGRALTEQLLASLRPETWLVIMYGQTEASARLTWLPPRRLREKLGSVGVAIPGVEIRVVDDEMRSVAAGIEGEVVARGDNVMAGYWQSQELTNEALAGGWLHTGDIGHLDADGYLYLSGRRSEMIKTGAHRVSPEEIEEVIRELPDIADVAAFGVEDTLLGQAINIAVVGSASAERERMILRHCREQLALHKVPRKVHWRPSLPKTVSGKLKRFELAAEIAKESL